MKQADALSWLEQLISQSGSLIRAGGALGSQYDPKEFSAWASESAAAIAAIFPSSHPISLSWEAAIKRKAVAGMNFDGAIKQCIGALEGARNLVRDGRLSSILDGVRAETVDELLDQAEHLASQNYAVAATVVAGGALETFLHFKCTTNGLTWQGHGSIDKYKGLLAEARKSGTEIVSVTDEKSITAWGGLRNDAAHRPGDFKESSERAKLMVEGIRQFIMKYS